MEHKVFVTGVTGKSGYFFLKQCLSSKLEGYKFTFLVRNREKIQDLLSQIESAKVICGSIEDKELINNELRSGEYDTILHIAGIQRSLDLVEAAINTNVKWFVLVHTTGIYSKYKAAGEGYREIEKKIKNIIEGKNIALTILRPTMIYGNLQDRNVSVFMKMVYKMRLFPVVNNATFELQPVWCGDLGKAYFQVIMNPEKTKNKEYNLSGGAPIMLIDMLKYMANRLNVKNKFINVPFGFAYLGSWVIYILTLGKIDYREKVQRLVEPRVYSHDEATKDFGYNPVTFEVGVEDEIKQFMVQNAILNDHTN